MLTSFSNAMNHDRFLCQVMAEEEPDAGLKKFFDRHQEGLRRSLRPRFRAVEQGILQEPRWKVEEPTEDATPVAIVDARRYTGIYTVKTIFRQG